jgi:hypothetical protein
MGRLRRVFLLFLSGIVAAVAVAAACAAWSPATPANGRMMLGFGMRSDEIEAWYAERVGEACFPSGPEATQRLLPSDDRVGWRCRELGCPKAFGRPHSPVANPVCCPRILRVWSGWPFDCLYGERWTLVPGRNVTADIRFVASLEIPRGLSLPEPPRSANGADWDRRILPLRPVWTGLMLDAIIFALILLGARSGLRVGRRLITAARRRDLGCLARVTDRRLIGLPVRPMLIMWMLLLLATLVPSWWGYGMSTLIGWGGGGADPNRHSAAVLCGLPFPWISLVHAWHASHGIDDWSVRAVHFNLLAFDVLSIVGLGFAACWCATRRRWIGAGAGLVIVALGLGLQLPVASGLPVHEFIAGRASIGLPPWSDQQMMLWNRPVGLYLVVAGVAILVLCGRGWRRKAGFCRQCGYALRGIRGRICPECGGEASRRRGRSVGYDAIVSLLVGTLLTVAVAWGSAWVSGFPGGISYRGFAAGGGSTASVLTTTMTTARRVHVHLRPAGPTSGRPGQVDRAASEHPASALLTRAESSYVNRMLAQVGATTCPEQIIESRGWPQVALWGAVDGGTGGAVESWWAYPVGPRVRWGAVVPREQVFLPLRPVWPGFLLDTVIYGSVVFLLLLATRPHASRWSG